MTQTEQILDHLKSVGSITGIEAWSLYKSRSLSRRITDLRQQGYSITSEYKRDHTGQRYVRYWLNRKDPVKPKSVKPVYEYSKRLLESVNPETLERGLEGDTGELAAAFYFSDTSQGHNYWWDKYDNEIPLTKEDREYLVGMLKAIKAQYSDELLKSVSTDALKAVLKDWWKGESDNYGVLVYAFAWACTAQGYEHWRDVKNNRVMTWEDYQYLKNMLWAKTSKGTE